jgi:hypothetical protein
LYDGCDWCGGHVMHDGCDWCGGHVMHDGCDWCGARYVRCRTAFATAVRSGAMLAKNPRLAPADSNVSAFVQ